VLTNAVSVFRLSENDNFAVPENKRGPASKTLPLVRPASTQQGNWETF